MKETRTLEYKAEITNTFLKTVSAFANFSTGSIQFGISDDGTVTGIMHPEQACLDIENKINDSINPKPNYTLAVNKRTNVITLTVSEGPYKPYLYKGKAYRRSDTATVEVDQLELKRLTLEGSNLYFEELPCKDKNLSFSVLESKLIERLGIEKITNDMLYTFGFYTKDKEPNIAAALFSDKNSFCGIDAVRFGNTINDILDRETFSHMSILQQYDNVVSMFRRYYQYETIKGLDRIRVELIPESAFREAIANALVHRTWDINSHIKVEMFPDKIEITSPGGLPRGLSKEEYLHGNISNLRNPIIGNLFFRLQYIEMFGTGIRRIQEAYEGHTLKPIFTIYDNSVRVSLPLLSETYAVTSEGEEILLQLEGGALLSTAELAEKLGWSKAKTLRVLNILKEQHYITTVGNGRGTKYRKDTL